MTRLILFFMILLTTTVLDAQDLTRKGVTGFRADYQADVKGAKIFRIIPASPADKAGLKTDDVITSIDGQPVTNAIVLERKVSVVKANQKVKLTVISNGKQKEVTITAMAPPLEKNNNKTEYGIVSSNGTRLRTITTVPPTTGRKFPAVLMIQWLSCGSLELPIKSRDGTDTLMRVFANSPDFIFMRVERRGTGDSEGGPCVDCTLEEELEGYRSALAQLRQRPDVDPDKIFLFGLSLGGSLAPVVGDGQNIRGYMVSGACTQTWFEHMLDIERRRLKFTGSSPAQVNEQIKKFSKFYELYYIEKMTPREIEQKYPDMKGLWYDEPEHQYERPAKFYQSVQDLNIEGAWNKVNVPVLIVFGENDWIMSLTDHTRIAEIVNNNHPGNATLEVMKGLGHNLDRYPSMKDSFTGTGRVVDGGANQVFLKWIDAQLKK